MDDKTRSEAPLGALRDTAEVELAPELVPLLSAQLYQSPLKAVEELVVNSFDAEAKECYVSMLPVGGLATTVSVADDGFGMDVEGLKNLWHVGRSEKRNTEYLQRVTRKQIGKFGIGKLAAYSIAKVITYYTKVGDEIRFASLNFGAFEESKDEKVLIPIYGVSVDGDGYEELLERLQEATIAPKEFLKRDTWTICVLNSLRPRAHDIRVGRLEWVLRTAMPLAKNFSLFLNGKAVASAKAAIPRVVEIGLADISPDRIQELSKRVEGLRLVGTKLIADSLPSGVSATAEVFEQTLSGGKAEDLGRSHGFFVMVRGRLINERDELFGMSPASYQTWFRFQGTIHADDLDSQITASREGVEESESVRAVRAIANTLFTEARSRFEKWLVDQETRTRQKKEEGRNPVSPRLVELPVADAVRRFGTQSSGADADTSWFYLDIENEDQDSLSELLYGPREGVYSYRVEGLGEDERLVKFHPREKLFVLNEQHPLVREYSDGDRFSVRLLQDFVTAEALLEVNLRQAGVPLRTIGEILQTRDKLIRSLARDEIYSLKSVADELRKAFDDQYDLEIALVASARALGLIAKHISGAGKPDGIARFIASDGTETKVTLEAKSSSATPSLGAIDFGGLKEHIQNEGASACLLVAPSYPGGSREDDAAAARRAVDARVSCWTIEQLASVVEAAEAREISARDILTIVERAYTPDAVKAAVNDLLASPNGHRKEVYTAVVDAMEFMVTRGVGKTLTTDMLVGRIVGQRDIDAEDVARAVQVVAEASKGLIKSRGGEIAVLGSFEEVRRRLGNLIGGAVDARRLGDFRDRH